MAPDRMPLRTGPQASSSVMRRRALIGHSGVALSRRSVDVTSLAVLVVLRPLFRMFGFVLFSTVVDHSSEANRHPTRSQGLTTAGHVRSGSSMRVAEAKLCFVSVPVASAARGRGTVQGTRCCCGRDPHRTELRVDHPKLWQQSNLRTREPNHYHLFDHPHLPRFGTTCQASSRQSSLRGTMVGDDPRQLQHISLKLAEGWQKRHTTTPSVARGHSGQMPKCRSSGDAVSKTGGNFSV
ncbi:hypothetical protein B0T18DRAFT_10512 [Schizothecium vesticola]|uniref:Uncharacterized protein n=1 Tax=Schizothecium vesticola TaxID=314040 RepID=A0AA40F923_9PEZI|nr:hypothetical protein B0T18DRAFT_10512 [Schizothecium vesticola]